MNPVEGLITIDLQAAQSPHYVERGIARYALDYTRAVTAVAPELFRQLLLSPTLPEIRGLESIRKRVPVRTEPAWDASGGIFHALSPFELDVPIQQLWPREASRSGMRLVVTLYDLIPELFPETYLQDPGQRRRYRARRELVRAADHVLTLSQSAADDAVNLLGIPDERVTVIGAAPAETFRPAADRAKTLTEIRRQIPRLAERFLVYNGAVEPRKNMEALLEAFAELPAEVRSGWQLVLVCRLSQSERNHFDVRSRELNLGDHLLLTGFVPDEQLVSLYQTAELVVYPSLYEGYGLPVAEALACGAAVIASSTSSLPELVAPDATFDPRSRAGIAEALSHALSDSSFRDGLRDWARSRHQSWDAVASSALRVYEQLLALPGSPSSRWRARPLIAFVSPLPPARSGVADYTARLTGGFGEMADVHLFADGDETPMGLPKAAALSSYDKAHGGYEAKVLVLGNSEFHAGALKLLRVNHEDALVQAHDAKLTDLYLHGEARGAVPEGARTVVADLYPDLQLKTGDSQRVLQGAAKDGALMTREIVTLAREVLATSGEAADMIRQDCEPVHKSKVAIWDFAYAGAVERDASGVEGGLVCSFGVINPVKAPDTVIRSFAEMKKHGAADRLALVGPISIELEGELQDLALCLGVNDSTVFTGDIPDEEYRSWLRRASVALQLRVGSNGETSAAVADCLTYGIPVVVTALGPQAGLPEFVPKVRPDVSADELAAVVERLLADDHAREDFALKSRAFVSSRSFENAARWFMRHIA